MPVQELRTPVCRTRSKEYGDYFGICVAGYPEAHPDGIVEDPEQMDKNYWADIAYLKQKVEAGADFIITQLFYDVDIFVKFVADCRSVGITVPILPGIMPIMTYGGFKRMTGFCKTKVPAEISDALEAIKDNDEAVRNFGIDLGVTMCRRLMEAGTPGLHMYTLNLERSAVAILEKLGLVDTKGVPRSLPWSHVPQGTSRAVEAVRPVFWSARPKAYLRRTQGWPAYPAGRWGDVSPAFAELPDSPFMRRHSGSEKAREKARAAWGAALAGEEDVRAVFSKYAQGEISLFPWSEGEGGLSAEAAPVRDTLAALAAAGYLTINCQPAVNGAASTDAVHGWGAPGGYVYGKSYLEFFVSPAAWESLRSRFDAAPSVSYVASTSSGSPSGSLAAGDVVGLKWGAFPACSRTDSVSPGPAPARPAPPARRPHPAPTSRPRPPAPAPIPTPHGKEVIQPTVLCATSFGTWKDEAFALWSSEWAALYEGEEGAASRQVLEGIAGSWVLVAAVDNDYVTGDLAKVILG
ncbi:hypothetical protein GPECTOR_12g523 [Gonium pectorale]|uniref:MTHFR SAM-binding regulatory domain-containing protein n=1 Tax=Gonium pectorale TaxID=33097 RepID=A0A150GQD5_GONPE|nr:hypothetical protein GPECTOR_12g523 [Gonium pectorale]|eukprot:KXZ51560.1 hypothetical protein GPECTOR_12g523 [Gonium pectorale]